MLPLMEFGSFNIPANSNVNEFFFLTQTNGRCHQKNLKIPKG